MMISVLLVIFVPLTFGQNKMDTNCIQREKVRHVRKAVQVIYWWMESAMKNATIQGSVRSKIYFTAKFHGLT